MAAQQQQQQQQPFSVEALHNELVLTRQQLRDADAQYDKLKMVSKRALQEFNRVKAELAQESHRRSELEAHIADGAAAGTGSQGARLLKRDVPASLSIVPPPASQSQHSFSSQGDPTSPLSPTSPRAAAYLNSQLARLGISVSPPGTPPLAMPQISAATQTSPAATACAECSALRGQIARLMQENQEQQLQIDILRHRQASSRLRTSSSDRSLTGSHRNRSTSGQRGSSLQSRRSSSNSLNGAETAAVSHSEYQNQSDDLNSSYSYDFHNDYDYVDERSIPDPNSRRGSAASFGAANVLNVNTNATAAAATKASPPPALPDKLPNKLNASLPALPTALAKSAPICSPDEPMTPPTDGDSNSSYVVARPPRFDSFNDIATTARKDSLQDFSAAVRQRATNVPHAIREAPAPSEPDTESNYSGDARRTNNLAPPPKSTAMNHLMAATGSTFTSVIPPSPAGARSGALSPTKEHMFQFPQPKKPKSTKKFGLSSVHNALNKFKDKLLDVDGDDSASHQYMQTGRKKSQSNIHDHSDAASPQPHSGVGLTGDKSHIFQSQTFKKMVKCGVCGDRIWGVNAYEMMCRCCGFACHSRCAPNASARCPGAIENQPLSPSARKGGKAMYGVDLIEHCTAEQRRIPIVMEKCITTVEQCGLDQEGIYRKSGPLMQIRAIIAEFDRGVVPALENPDTYGDDITVITSVMKQYLRDLPNPLITFGVYPLVCEAMKIPDETKNRALRKAIDSLPPIHHTTFHYLFTHLLRVVQNSAENRMTPRNLGVVFGPTLMRDPNSLTGYDLTSIVVVEYLLENYAAIFGPTSNGAFAVSTDSLPQQPQQQQQHQFGGSSASLVPSAHSTPTLAPTAIQQHQLLSPGRNHAANTSEDNLLRPLVPHNISSPTLDMHNSQGRGRAASSPAPSLSLDTSSFEAGLGVGILTEFGDK